MPHLKPGQVFDRRYTLIKPIGVGASGEVWLARDEQIPRDVALKVMNVMLTEQRLHLERFQREINSLNELGNSHPNIPQLYSANITGERPYIVMEYIGGTSLKTLIDTQEIYQIPFYKRITYVIQQLADALSYAHDREIVHRDIKPENVKIMGEADRTYLLDFSIAVVSSAETRSGVGTPKYVAPEINSSPAADIFSFGMVCYEILFGRHPFYASDEIIRGPFQAKGLLEERIINHKWYLPSAMAKMMPNIPSDIDWAKVDVVFREVFTLDPASRPTHAQALAAGLRAAFHTETTSELVLSELRAGRTTQLVQDELGAILDSSHSTYLDSSSITATRSDTRGRLALPPYIIKRVQDPIFLSWGLLMIMLGIMIGVVIG